MKPKKNPLVTQCVSLLYDENIIVEALTCEFQMKLALHN